MSDTSTRAQPSSDRAQIDAVVERVRDAGGHGLVIPTHATGTMTPVDGGKLAGGAR
ncbi:MAG: hypothetical protein ACRDPM_25270 [Solirubrobacteraceae bacterium]